MAGKNAPATAIEEVDLSGFGGFSDLMSDASAEAEPNGRPLMLAHDIVFPDPDNTRDGEDEEDVRKRDEFVERELGPDVKERGVKSPISVRTHPDKPGCFMINHGENRWLATAWAGRTEIPAFIDEDFTSYDNAKENLKRLGLSHRQMARFVARKLAEGDNKKEIAEKLGVSPSLVNQLSNLLKMPPPIKKAYDAGKCRDLTTIAELMTLFKKYPTDVTNWLDEQDDEVLRSAVKALRLDLEEPNQPPEKPFKMTEERGGAGSGVRDPQQSGEGGSSGGGGSGEKEPPLRDPNTIDLLNGTADADLQGGQGGDETPPVTYLPPEDPESGKKPPAAPETPDPDKIKRAIVQVEHDSRPARLIQDRRPPAVGWAFIKYDDDGHEVEVDLLTVKLVALIEG